jgi:guanine deaminase
MGRTDTEALDAFGLLRRSTVLAHCDQVSDTDLALMRGAGAGVAHCPLSNAYFSNGVFPTRRALAAGVHVGLGTDVAGGAEPGLLAQCAHAVSASRYLEAGVDPGLAPDRRGVPDSRIDIVEAFWLATGGGAALLGEPLGLIEPGRRFDAIVVDHDASAISPLRRWDVDDDARYFEKIVRLGTPADITHVWVDGQLRGGTAH